MEKQAKTVESMETRLFHKTLKSQELQQWCGSESSALVSWA